MKKLNQLFFTSKVVNISIGVSTLLYVVYVGQTIILPFVFSILAAIVLNPFVNYLTKKKWNRVLAILVVLLLTMILLSVLSFFIFSQLSLLENTFPLWKEKFSVFLNALANWISQTFKISTLKTNAWINKITHQEISGSVLFIEQTFSTVINFLLILIVIPIYIFLLLFYKHLLLKFISELFTDDKHIVIVDILNQTKMLIQYYLLGLLIETSIVASLNIITLLMIGIDYAILIGILCAILNIVPYIGGIIAVILTMVFALITKSPSSAVFVLVAHMVVQLIDNYFLMPKIVGSKVKINALVSIIVVLIGGKLCGFAGMFLSIPITAIFKLIFDKVQTLKAFGSMLGDVLPVEGKSIFNIDKSEKE
jgi:predicted PurR-regulated permease PerM